MKHEVKDLRTVLELLRGMPGQLVETDVEVDPAAELSGVYRHVGAGGTVQRPTKVNGPAMIFNKIKGFDDARVAIGVLGSRKRVAALFDCQPEELGKLLCRCAEKPIEPIVVEGDAPCQQVVHLATDIRPRFGVWENVPGAFSSGSPKGEDFRIVL
ncbi:MAG: UbiD family decarboxylase, partial [Faecousia sp.]